MKCASAYDLTGLSYTPNDLFLRYNFLVDDEYEILVIFNVQGGCSYSHFSHTCAMSLKTKRILSLTRVRDIL